MCERSSNPLVLYSSSSYLDRHLTMLREIRKEAKMAQNYMQGMPNVDK